MPVSFAETLQVKEGVECDVYTFDGDSSRDLAIVRVAKGYKTPLQKILLGDMTVEGFVSGGGTLTVQAADSAVQTYVFPATSVTAVVVERGSTMQWDANGDTDLTFYEICEPPYKEGRFKNLPED